MVARHMKHFSSGIVREARERTLAFTQGDESLRSGAIAEHLRSLAILVREGLNRGGNLLSRRRDVRRGARLFRLGLQDPGNRAEAEDESRYSHYALLWLISAWARRRPGR